MNSAFYVPLDELRFRATDATVGPWGPALQHGSPPAALLGHLLETRLPRPDARVAQMAFDFFGPLAVTEVSADLEVIRPGARIELSRARLWLAGRVAMQASAWRIAVQEGRVPVIPLGRTLPRLPDPQPNSVLRVLPSFLYAEAVEWRFANGAFETLGPATAWARPRVPLVEGVPVSPLVRLLLMVDSANGISAELDPSRYTFVPVALTVTIHRYPRTEWVGMTARSVIDGGGIGVTHADLFDEEDYLGSAIQTLFVAPRT
ncbi:MAG TPA: thioesterase family protein [Polyangiaceae bacterium]